MMLVDKSVPANKMTKRFNTAFKPPAKTGKYHEPFNTRFAFTLSSRRNIPTAASADTPVANIIIQGPYCSSNCICCVFCTIKQQAFDKKIISTKSSHFMLKGCFSPLPGYKQRLKDTTTKARPKPISRVNAVSQKQKPHTVVPMSESCKINEVKDTEPIFKALINTKLHTIYPAAKSKACGKTAQVNAPSIKNKVSQQTKLLMSNRMV